MAFKRMCYSLIFYQSYVLTFNDLSNNNINLMIIKLQSIIALVILFQSVLIAAKYFESPINQYVGDNNSTSTFKLTSSKKQLIGVLFTNRNCQQCYESESQLIFLIDQIWKVQKIKIYRCELALNPNLQEEFNIKRFPMLHFVLPGQNYKLYHNYNILQFSSISKIVKKLKNSLYHDDSSQLIDKNRIIVNIDFFDFFEKSQWFSQFSLNPLYQNLPSFQFLQQTSFINRLKQFHVQQQQLSKCSIFIPQNNKCYSPSSHEQLNYIFSLSLFDQVTQFTESNYRLYQTLELNRYVFVAVIDSIFNRQESYHYIEMLNQLLTHRQFKNKITIFWMEVQLNRQKLQHLGFKITDQPPLFAQFQLNNPVKHILKNEMGPIFTSADIVKFIKSLVQFDQDQEIKLWNEQLLLQSMKRLKIKDIILANSEIQVKQEYNFVLSFPYFQFHQLNNNEVFYSLLMNYRYLIQRIKRFTDRKSIAAYLTFSHIKYFKTQGTGLFSCTHQVCEHLSHDVLFDLEKVSKNNNFLLNTFNLPKYFWVNQNIYHQHLKQKQEQHQIEEYDYIFIDI